MKSRLTSLILMILLLLSVIPTGAAAETSDQHTEAGQKDAAALSSKRDGGNESIPLTIVNGAHGTVTCETQVQKGETYTVSVTLDQGYRLSELSVDGGTATKTSFTVSTATDVTAITLTATFAPCRDKTSIAAGKCGDNAYWTLYDDGELFITGTGATYSYFCTDRYIPEWAEYSDRIFTVTVDEGITTFGGAILNPEWHHPLYTTHVTEVYLPSTIKEIGELCFGSAVINIHVAEDNENYRTVDGVLYDKSGETLLAFPRGRSGGFTVPEGVTTLSKASFRGVGLSEVRTSSTVKTIDGAFLYCGALRTVYLNPGLKTVTVDSFFSCWGLQAVVIYKGLEHFNYAAFSQTGLKDVYFYGTKKDWPMIGQNYDISYAVWHYLEDDDHVVTLNLKSRGNGTVSGPAMVETGKSYPLSARPAVGYRLDKISIDRGTVNGNTITIASGSDFRSVTAVATFCPIRSGEDTIVGGGNAGGLTWTLYDDGTLVISGTGGMSPCATDTDVPWNPYDSDINRVIVDPGVTHLDDFAFDGCASLTDITVTPGSSDYYGREGILYDAGGTEVIRCPEGKEGVVAIPDDVTGVAPEAFDGCDQITDLVLFASVTDLEEDSLPDDFPGTVWCYQGSAVDEYATGKGLTVRYLDGEDFTVTVSELPAWLIVRPNGKLLNGPRVTAEYAPNIGSTTPVRIPITNYRYTLGKPYGAATEFTVCLGTPTDFVLGVIRQGDVNGDTRLHPDGTPVAYTGIDVLDMERLWELLATGDCERLYADADYLIRVADVNCDGEVNILDYQALYEMIRQQ